MSILCNNAGVAGDQHVTRLTYEYWDWVIGINLTGVINGVQTFLPRMLKQGGGGHIVNTASGAGLAATSSGLLYTTSKFAVMGLSNRCGSRSKRSRLESAYCAPVQSIRRSYRTAARRGPYRR